jgi:hypothetical protein
MGVSAHFTQSAQSSYYLESIEKKEFNSCMIMGYYLLTVVKETNVDE